ncbi:MAG: beta-N-acetylhexosaminidase [Calditrichaeota bacterium]|nr:MAG: beta-N-acetylhexosaminidase [Calditrichota bacterium]
MLPTPEHEYIQNELIRKLPDDKLGHLIPTPVQYTPNRGQVVISNAMTILYAKELENEANYLTKTFAAQFGVNLNKRLGSSDVSPSIILRISDVKVNGISNEAYHLQISPDKGILITGSDPAGVFYGIISLLALTEAEANSLPAIQAADIIDAPRFHFRGLLLDVSRNFQKKEAVLKLIDLLAFYKINILNLRLTEDEGWRIEIKGLPELTNIGARRGHTLNDADCLPPSFGSGPFPNAAESYGNGYYSREDFKEILLHAHHRHIQIVPEICFPSHARAAIKSMEARYRHYVEQGDITAAEEFRLIDPLDRSVFESAQLYKDNIACVALNSTCHFYKTVVQDIREMYHEVGLELSFLHSGGDEVPRNAWTRSPECQKLIEDHPEIGGMRNLQAWFFNRLLLTLAEYDLQVGGWEEVVLTRDSLDAFSINKQFLSRQVIPYVWNNTGDNLDLGYRIANAGYSIVMCNVTNLYFDLSYNADPREPGLYWGGFQDAKDPFLLAPFDVFKTAMYDDFGNLLAKELPFERLQTLEPTHRKNILGLQAQLWTETVKGQAMMEYYILPKLFAFAEKAWASAPAWESDPDLRRRTKKIDDDWNEFANRIGQREFPRLDHLFGGFNYRIPMPGAVIENGWLKANIAYPGLTIRYTLDGSQPTMDSPITTQPMQVHTPVKLAAFSAAGRRGWIAEIK